MITARKQLVERYGSEPDVLKRVLVVWVEFTLLITAGWPLVVLLFQAPTFSVQNLPFGWFLLRLGLAAVAAAGVLLIWYSSDIPIAGIRLQDLIITLRDWRWLQATLFFAGLDFALGGVLIANNPADAAKLLTYGLLEAIAMQALILGLLYSTFETLGFPMRRSRILCTFLMTATIAMQSVFLTAVQDDVTGGSLLNALLFGILAGILIGWLWAWTRSRTGAIFIGVLSQWLLFSILPVFL